MLIMKHLKILAWHALHFVIPQNMAHFAEKFGIFFWLRVGNTFRTQRFFFLKRSEVCKVLLKKATFLREKINNNLVDFA